MRCVTLLYRAAAVWGRASPHVDAITPDLLLMRCYTLHCGAAWHRLQCEQRRSQKFFLGEQKFGSWGRALVGCRSNDACPKSFTIQSCWVSVSDLIDKQQVHQSPVSVALAERDSQPSPMTPPKISSDLHELQDGLGQSGVEQLLHLLRTTSYATECEWTSTPYIVHCKGAFTLQKIMCFLFNGVYRASSHSFHLILLSFNVSFCLMTASLQLGSFIQFDKQCTVHWAHSMGP